MKKKKNVSRCKSIRIIPDKIFDELWTLANSTNIDTNYYSLIVSSNSKYHLLYKKYDIKYEYFLDMLKNIFVAAHMSVNDIIAYSSMKKSAFAHLFCIPYRTLENWCNGSRTCPDYVRLMMLRQFKLIKLGHHIYISSEAPRERKSTIKKENLVVPEELPTISKESYSSIKQWEQEHVHYKDSSVEDLLNKLKYLDRTIK